ncbi:MAG: 3'(2'),5'-bisphosphate nucleotidase CysQ [Pseudolabrys sp.]
MDRLLDELTTIVSTASAAILKIRAGSLETRTKADLSPVTAADEAAEATILSGLTGVLPGVPVISEEAAERTPPIGPGPEFVLVDPLDGTRELVAGRDEFTVNVALVKEGRPYLGIVAAPALGLLWRGYPGRGAERLRLAADGTTGGAEAIRSRTCPPAGLVAAISRSHLDAETLAFLARLPVGRTISCGSAIKFCQVAEGLADVYPRFGTTCEWDIAAGQAVLAAAGGTVLSLGGTELPYGQAVARFRVPGFIAWGDPAAAARA